MTSSKDSEKVSSKDKKETKKRKSHRKQHDEDDDDAKDDPVLFQNKKMKGLSEEHNPEDLKQVERDRDQEEREAFEERLRARDDARTKKVGVSSAVIPLPDEKSAKEISAEEKRQQLPSLREVSRQEYLKKRRDQQLDLLEFQVKDEAFLFGTEALTSKEIKKHKLNEQLLDIAHTKVKKKDVSFSFFFLIF